MSFRYIDMEHYERIEHFRYFLSMPYPYAGVIVEYDACPTSRSFTPLSAPSLPRSMRKRADRRAFLYRDRKSEKAVFAAFSDFSAGEKLRGVQRREE